MHGHSCEQFSHAQQPPASDTADDSTEAHRRHLLAEAAARGADKAASEQRAADASFEKAGKRKKKVSKHTPTFDKQAVWKAKAQDHMAASKAGHEAWVRKEAVAKAQREAKQQAAACIEDIKVAKAKAKAAEEQAAAELKAAEERAEAQAAEQA